MAIFDDNVYAVLKYAGSLSDLSLKRELLVALVKDRARYMGSDVIEKFYNKAYLKLVTEKDACNYMLSIPLLKKLYDVALARGVLDTVRLEGKPDEDGLRKITMKIESIR